MTTIIGNLRRRRIVETSQFLGQICNGCRRQCTTDAFISEGDMVLLRRKGKVDYPPILTKPLSHGHQIHSHVGTLDHSNIIGKRVRDVVDFSRGGTHRIHRPTLAEYVELTPRMVTPVYPTDANLIVSLMDIHVSPTNPCATSLQNPKLEILEAGTGHGALTLHLARAIHAANPREQDISVGLSRPSGHESVQSAKGAIVHTIDISAPNSAHARKIVSGFRRGLYSGDVEFYTGDVSDWIKDQLQSRASTKPFLSHALLDLPATHLYLSGVATALRADGVLAAFNPNITQLTQCVELIRERKLPFVLDRVIELGGSAGGREWDVRPVKPRALLKAEQEKRMASVTIAAGTTQIDEEETTTLDENVDVELARTGFVEKARAEEHAESAVEQDRGWEMICRPKVGHRVVGGGFLGVWRRMRDTNESED